MKDNGFKLTKQRSWRYPTQTIAHADYSTDILILANTPTQTVSLLRSQEPAAAGIGIHVKAQKMQYMCSYQRGYISTLNGTYLKPVDKFTYQGSSVSSTETDINTQQAKAKIANDGLSVI